MFPTLLPWGYMKYIHQNTKLITGREFLLSAFLSNLFGNINVELQSVINETMGNMMRIAKLGLTQ